MFKEMLGGREGGRKGGGGRGRERGWRVEIARGSSDSRTARQQDSWTAARQDSIRQYRTAGQYGTAR